MAWIKSYCSATGKTVHMVRISLLAALLLLAGCYRPADVAPAPPDASSVSDVSEQSIRTIAAELAKVSRQVAEKAGQLEDHGQLLEFELPLNKIALKSSLQPATEVLDAQFEKDAQGNLVYDAAKVRKAFEERAEGFERVAKEKK
jgi:uncharacterized lipoprotein YajG